MCRDGVGGESGARKEWLGLALLALACVVYAMDLTVLHLAVPSLSEDLQPTSTQLLWIVDIYGFMVAGMLITQGHPRRPQRPPAALGGGRSARAGRRSGERGVRHSRLP